MREELKLRLEWAVGMLHAVRRADDIVFARLIAQGGIDLATADEEAMREAGNQEALESLAEARAKDANPPQEERSDPLDLAARHEGLQPVSVKGEEGLGPLGASKAPSCGSPTGSETPSGGWLPTTGVNPAPGARVDVRFRNGEVCRDDRSEAWDWALEPTGDCIVVAWRPAGSPTDCQTSGGAK